MQPLRSTPLQGLQRYYGLLRPCRCASVLSPSRSTPHVASPVMPAFEPGATVSPISAPRLLSSRLALVTRGWPVASVQPAEGGMPMNSNLTSTLSEFSKGRWASELLKHPSLRPTELHLKSERLALPSAKIFSRRDLAHFVGRVHKLILRMFQCLGNLRLVTPARSWLDNVAPVAFARYLIAFFIG